MKASLRSKILVLSLASLVVIGTGCERRGRAPKPQTAGAPNVQTTVDKNKTPAPTAPDETGKPSTPSNSSSLKELIAKAQFAGAGCDISIDASESPTLQNYVKDYSAVLKLYGCEKANGVALSKSTAKIEDRTWSIDAASSQKPGEAPSKMLAEFIRIAKDSNDDKANEVISARIDVFQTAAAEMNAKYGDERLASTTEISYKADGEMLKTTIAVTQADLAKMSAALETGRVELGKMRSVVKGAEATLNTAE